MGVFHQTEHRYIDQDQIITNVIQVYLYLTLIHNHLNKFIIEIKDTI